MGAAPAALGSRNGVIVATNGRLRKEGDTLPRDASVRWLRWPERTQRRNVTRKSRE